MRPICIGIDIIDYCAAVLAEVQFAACCDIAFFSRVIHTGMLGRVEMRPLRLRVKSCLNSPRLILLVTLLT